MASHASAAQTGFDRLRERSIGLPQVLFQSITHIAPGAAIVFFLTYRDVRLSTNAGVLLGIFEISVFVALALWMILSNVGDLTLQTFNPSHNEVGTLEGTFKGMV